MRNPFATPPAETRPFIGFHGKAPAYGDFVTRDVPSPFLNVWDAMLQTLMRSAQTALGVQWREAFLDAPVWHFGLGEGVAAPQRVWGVLIPSVDRVGRYFPFTILASATANGRALDAWAPQAETLALGALEDAFTADALAAGLARLGHPEPGPPAGTNEPQAALPEDAAPWPDAVAAAAGPAKGASLWWCRGSARVRPCLRRMPNLPESGQAARLVSD